MISINELFHKVITESKEGISHLPHLVEKAITGNPDEVLIHLSDLSNFIQNKPTIGTVTNKADGKVSIHFGKNKKGVPFVHYKGSGARNIPLSSTDDIEAWVTQHNKPYLRDSLMMGLEAAKHPKIESNTKFQADTMIHHSSDAVKGNIIFYKKPSKQTKSMLAVHTVIKDGQAFSAPDLSRLSTPSLAFPNLSVSHIPRSATPDEIKKLNYHMREAQRLFADPEVKRVSKAIATHVDPTKKTGARHVFFREFNNAFQRGEHGDRRTVDSLMTFGALKSAKTKSDADVQRIIGHIKFISQRRGMKSNALAIQSMLTAHDHVDNAREIIINVLNRTGPELKPIDPETGKVNYNMGEGWVHTIPGRDPIKLVPREFTRRNAAESSARRKKSLNENEGGAMMTASGGGISGMGYNLGGPAPDDVAVAPLKNRMASKSARPFRRKLMTKLLGRMNVGREAY